MRCTSEHNAEAYLVQMAFVNLKLGPRHRLQSCFLAMQTHPAVHIKQAHSLAYESDLHKRTAGSLTIYCSFQGVQTKLKLKHNHNIGVSL